MTSKLTTLSAENIINTLEKLNQNSDPIEDDAVKIKNNKEICRLVNIQLKDFYDDIYIPFNFFREGDWKISKILYDNEDIMFFNNKYLTNEDEDKFYEVFSKYISMLEEILSSDNKLYIFLKNWTDMSGVKWKKNKSKSYLKSLLTDSKYQYISPAYTTNIYCEFSKKYRDDSNRIKLEIENHLDEIIKKVKTEAKLFRETYNEIIACYVYEYPPNKEDRNTYILGFINSIILTIVQFADKLIDLNVYAIHPIINQIIGYYTPIDEINQYHASENGNRKLYIV